MASAQRPPWRCGGGLLVWWSGGGKGGVGGMGVARGVRIVVGLVGRVSHGVVGVVMIVTALVVVMLLCSTWGLSCCSSWSGGSDVVPC